MDAVKFIFHLIACAVSVFATSYDYFVIKIERNSGAMVMGGKFKYLTFWNMCFQSVYFTLNVICDLVEKKSNPGNPSQRETVQKWRDALHSCLLFPTTMFVGVSFWAIYAVDRELIFPKSLDGLFPVWLNHLVHTTILPFILIDKLVSHHHYPRKSRGLFGAGALVVLYLAWIFLIAYVDNFWVYPILEVLGIFQRTIFLSVCIAFFASFYILGEALTTFIWGKSPARSPSQGKTKTSQKLK